MSSAVHVTRGKWWLHVRFESKADIVSASDQVRFVPLATISPSLRADRPASSGVYRMRGLS